MTTIEKKSQSTELRELIVESQLVLKRLKRLVNILITALGIIAIPFLTSFISIHVRLAKLEGMVESKDFYYDTFVQKVDALAVHMYENQWINTQLYKITNSEEYKNSDERKILINGFFNTNSRGIKNGINTEDNSNIKYK